ncbi:UV-stimulated scaffold protein A isoform X2 [Eleutherodactylus coqui]|uniref:UV-stimulated scaffold protein A isoform X2 n=1 Tax=Eleutherodactylus coqui TaxID=57060 RepID=UPI0034628395
MEPTLEELVESLTTSGEPQLDPEKFKQLKKICKSSDEHIKHVYHLLMTQLNQNHAEIRLPAFHIISELFSRSHLFRTLLISNFQEFLELTVETDHDQPLPPPQEVAQKLKHLAIKTIQEWHEKFGEGYKKLSLGYHFLKQNKKVDFQDVRIRTVAERKREEEKQKRLENIYKEKAKRAKREMEEMLEDIQSCLTEMENCFSLLLPDPEDFSLVNDEKDDGDGILMKNNSLKPKSPQGGDDDEQPCCSKDLPQGAAPSTGLDPKGEGKVESSLKEPSDESDDDFAPVEESFIREHGLGSRNYTLNIEISTDTKINANEDNRDILNSLIDACKLAKNKYWPAVQSWIQIFTKAGISDDSLRFAIDLKKKLEGVVKKQEEMNIESKTRNTKAAADSDEDDDCFEEVPEKEGYEPHIPDHLRSEYGLDAAPKPTPPARTKRTRSRWRKRKRNDDESDPTCAAATLKAMRDKLSAITPSASSSGEHRSERAKREEELSRAPVVPFGIDLHYWGKDQPTAGKILKFSSQHRFWAPNDIEEEVENKEVEAMLKTRYITFPGKFEPVTHKCKAPMANGSLCERQDRIKCPFHGKIIPRDELGVPVNPEDREREAKEKFERQAREQDWRDPELMREIEQATGEDLGSSRCPKKGQKKKGKKKKYPNLTDLKQNANTSRSRLEKKVFNTGSVKRVISAMNQMDQRRHEKFANQFNYALN